MARSSSRVAVPVAAGLLGFLAVLAASQGSLPDRGARRLELADLIRDQDRRVSTLRRDLADLTVNLDELSAGVQDLDRTTGTLGRQVRQLSIRSGTAALRGPGVVVILDDSDAGRSPTGDPNDLIVHEQDIQTVVNALWSSGAEAVAINGERLTGASAVRCAGNTLLLHGRVHSPPYRIEAIGDDAALEEGLGTRPGMDRLHAAVSAFGLRLQVRVADVRIRAGGPAPGLELAEPA
ncbi:MAG TPA: DUF881 domain-containing protein [Actinomycetota bacterium]|jgi:uncharacterized protein YlxW (UPF0749 family)